jgi:hypothetical protein
MGVINVTERLPERATDSGLARFDLQRTLLIQTEQPTDDSLIIYGSGLIPGYLSSHPRLPRATMRRRVLKKVPSRESLWWECELEYSTAPIEERELQFATEADTNPLDRRSKITIESMPEREFSEKGFLKGVGNALFPGEFAEEETTIMNSAGEPFEPSPGHDIEVSRWAINVEKNVDSWPLWLTDYENTINETPVVFRGRFFGEATLKLGRIRMSDLKVEAFNLFYTVNFQIVYNSKTWDQDWLDQGYHELDRENPEKLKPIYVNGTRPSRPQLLDGEGHAGYFSGTGEFIRAQPTYRTYRRYQAREFNILPLY